MHDAHWYAPWLGRWVSCDPSGLTDGTNRYGFARGSPLVLVDPSGLQGEPAQAAAAAPAAGWSVSVTLGRAATRPVLPMGNRTRVRFEADSSGRDPAQRIADLLVALMWGAALVMLRRRPLV